MQLLFRLHVVGISLKSQMTSEELQSRGLSPSPMQLVKELWGLQPPQLPHLCMPKFMIWVHVCKLHRAYGVYGIITIDYFLQLGQCPRIIICVLRKQVGVRAVVSFISPCKIV